MPDPSRTYLPTSERSGAAVAILPQIFGSALFGSDGPPGASHRDARPWMGGPLSQTAERRQSRTPLAPAPSAKQSGIQDGWARRRLTRAAANPSIDPKRRRQNTDALLRVTNAIADDGLESPTMPATANQPTMRMRPGWKRDPT